MIGSPICVDLRHLRISRFAFAVWDDRLDIGDSPLGIQVRLIRDRRFLVRYPRSFNIEGRVFESKRNVFNTNWSFLNSETKTFDIEGRVLDIEGTLFNRDAAGFNIVAGVVTRKGSREDRQCMLNVAKGCKWTLSRNRTCLRPGSDLP